MLCRNCGIEIADKAMVCYRCGTPTTEAKYKPAAVRPNASRASWMFLVALAVLLLADAALFFVSDNRLRIGGWVLTTIAGLLVVVRYARARRGDTLDG
jgi:hypothetical protein